MSKAQLFSKLKYRSRWRLTRKHVIRNGAQGKHIKAWAVGGVGAVGFRGQIDQTGVFDVIFYMLRASSAVDGIGIACFARSGLPVHQLGGQCSALGAINHDALRPQGTVVQALGVGVFQSLGNVAHQLQALVNRELRATVAQQVIEPLGLGVVVKHQRGPHFSLFVVVDFQDARVADALQDLKLTSRLANTGCAGFWA